MSNSLESTHCNMILSELKFQLSTPLYNAYVVVSECLFYF